MSTWLHRGAVVIVALIGIGLLTVAARFLLQPAAAAAGFGVPAPADDPYLAVKGVRDLGTALMLLALITVRRYRALGAAMLVGCLIPLGDMTIVLATGGSVVLALSVHGLTALCGIAAALVLLCVPAPTGRSACDVRGDQLSTAHVVRH